jgi:hypothetical protein
VRSSDPLYALALSHRPSALARCSSGAQRVRAEVLAQPPSIGVLIVVSSEPPELALPPGAASEPAPVGASTRAAASYATHAELPCPTGLLVRIRA